MLERDRGRWWSEFERMKGNLDSSPPAPDVLRFRVTGGPLGNALDDSTAFVAELCSIILMLAARDRQVTGMRQSKRGA
jgi:hypothetical protein